MSFRIEKFNNINDFNSELEKATTFLSKTESVKENTVNVNQLNEKASQVDTLLRNNWDLLIDKTQDVELREKLFTNLDKLARDLDCADNKTDVVDKLLKKISLCIITFAPDRTGFTTDIQRALFPKEISVYVLVNMPADSENFSNSLKTLKSLHATSPELANVALAKWINRNKISMITVLEKSLNELHEIFPWLEYADLTGLHIKDEELEEFASVCPNLKILKTDSSALTKLPTNEHLKKNLNELHCKFCMSLQTLPEDYFNLKEFHFQKCAFSYEDFKKLPSECKIFQL